MKHIVLILTLFIIGCSPKGGPEQTLRMKDGREIECRLLSVRPNGLLVDTSQPPAHHITNAEIGLYSFESIDKFIYDPVSASKTIVLASSSGLVVGAVIGGFAAASMGAVDVFSDEPDQNSSTATYTALGVGVAGALTAILVNEINHFTYDPATAQDREHIAKLAIYKTEEPDELKKIK